MTSKATTPNKTVLDPVFPIPLGAEDAFVYSEQTAFITAPEDDSLGQEFGTGDEVGLDDTEGSSEDFEGSNETLLDTPTDFVVFSQTLRRAPGGQQVIDVVVDVEDVSGVTNYEFQVTKV